MGIIDKLFGKKKIEKETQASASCDLCETTIVQVKMRTELARKKYKIWLRAASRYTENYRQAL